MDDQTYKTLMERINKRKTNLEQQIEEDEFEAARYTTDWMCRQRSLTIDERIQLKQTIFLKLD